jgi:hypothetical protein
MPTRTKPLARRTLRVYSLRRRWSLEELTAHRYDDVDMNGNTSNTSMNINNCLIAQPSCYSDLQIKVDSNPIAHRVRRKHQRLPPSLLIENASDRVQTLWVGLCSEAFPIKASDDPAGIVASSTA